MADDTERLILQMSADLKAWQNSMVQAANQADRAAARIEQRFRQMNEKAAKDFENFKGQVESIIAAIGLHAIIHEVGELADVWTRVGNRLGFAGIAANQVASEQQVIADIALRSRSDLEITAEMYARILESSRALRVSQGDVALITETINKALVNVDPNERGGIAQALSLGLANGRIEARQLRTLLANSVPLAEAIAHEFNVGLNQLSTLGKEGELSASRVVHAILNAAPEIEHRFQQTNATIADSFTNLATQAARFVGTNNQTSGGAREFAQLIQSVATNFDALADAAVVAATVIGGTFAGIAVGKASAALIGMAGDLVTVAGRAEAAEAILGFFGGPFGIALAAAGAGMAYLALKTDVFTSASQAAERSQNSFAQALQLIATATPTTQAQGEATTHLSTAQAEAARTAHDAATGVESLGTAAEHARTATQLQADAANALAVAQREATIRTLDGAIADEQAIISTNRREIALRGLNNALANVIAGEDLEDERRRLHVPTDAQTNQAAQAAIAQAERDRALLTRGRNAIVSGLLEPASGRTDLGGNGSGDRGPNAHGGASIADLRLSAEISLARLLHDTAREQKLTEIQDIEKQTDALEHAGLSRAAARAEAEANVAASHKATLEVQAQSLATSELQNQIDLSRAQGLTSVADKLSDELDIRRRMLALTQQGVSAEDAKGQAERFVASMRAAQDEQAKFQNNIRNLTQEQAIAQARGDTATEHSLERQLAIQQRISELRQSGSNPEDAAAQATAEVDALEQAGIQGKFREWFSGGVMAALDGDFSDFIRNWWSDVYRRAMTDALNSVADLIFSIFNQAISGAVSGKSGGGGLFDFISSIISLGGGGKGGGKGGEVLKFIPGFASGGRTPRGPIRVGEFGPETLFMDQPGFVVPNGGMGGAVHVNYVDAKTIHFSGTSEELADLRRTLHEDQVGRRQQIVSVVADAFNRRQVLR